MNVAIECRKCCATPDEMGSVETGPTGSGIAGITIPRGFCVTASPDRRVLFLYCEDCYQDMVERGEIRK